MVTTDTADVPMAQPALIKVEEVAKPTLTPPASDEASKNGDSSSELSEPVDAELEEEEDIGEIEPDHYWDGGRIPVFKPVCAYFLCSLASTLSCRSIR